MLYLDFARSHLCTYVQDTSTATPHSPGAGVPRALPVSSPLTPFNFFFFFFFRGTTAGLEPYVPSVRYVEHVRHCAFGGGSQKTVGRSAPISQSRTLEGRDHDRSKTLTTQANTTHIPYIHHPPMTETRRPEINLSSSWHYQFFPCNLIRQERHHQILQQPILII